MANVGARVVHPGICTLRAQALSIGTSTHGQGLAAVTKDIPISSMVCLGVILARWWQRRPQLPATTSLWWTVLCSLVFLGLSPLGVGSERQAHHLPFVVRASPRTGRATPLPPQGVGRGGIRLMARVLVIRLAQ